MEPLPRSAGVLLHVTSLPSGRLDADAYAFVDWLAAAGCSWWQVLPIGPPDRHGSPYASASAFAGWDGLLAEPDAPVTDAERTEFRAANVYWLDDWLAYAGPGQLDAQVRFEREWQALRRYARDRGVRLIGDLPLYVESESADRQARPRYWRTDLVSGTEPNRLHPRGQYWGHPVYDWHALAADGFRWWIERFRRLLGLFDLVRVDHFRAFTRFWAIPADSSDPAEGFWLPGPGMGLFDVVRAELGALPLLAEEPGDLPPEVAELRSRIGVPGIAVLVRGFDDRVASRHRPENLAEDQVVYTATHDNDTVRGWYAALGEEERARVPVDPAEPHWGLIRLAAASPCRLAIVQAQDVLGLGSGARMNVPSTVGGANWRWRLRPGELTAAHAARLRRLLEENGRCDG